MPIDSAEDTTTESRSAAFFDVDGTLVSTHIVHQYVYFREYLSRQAGGIRVAFFPLWKRLFWLRCVRYLILDRVNRSRMNVAFYRNYAGLDAFLVKGAADACFDELLEPHLFCEAARCVGEHLRAGRRVVLVTGSIDFIIAPLARFLSELIDDDAHRDGGDRIGVVARTLIERDGVFTGALDGVPIGDEEKAVQMRDYAQTHGIDLTCSYAYGDSVADVPMLGSVGHPVVVNGDAELKKIAAERGWKQVIWKNVESGS